jgi:hypothetical protein
MTTNQEKYQPLIEFLENNEADFVIEIQDFIDFFIQLSTLGKNNTISSTKFNTVYNLVLLRNAIKECRTE